MYFPRQDRAADLPWQDRAAIGDILIIYCAVIDRAGQGIVQGTRSSGAQSPAGTQTRSRITRPS